MNIDFDELQACIMERFYQCNEMNGKRAEDYAWLAVHELKKQLGLVNHRKITDPTRVLTLHTQLSRPAIEIFKTQA